MVLTTEQRIELLAKARAAKANKKLALQEAVETPAVNVEPPVEQPATPKVKKSRKKNEIAPLPEPVQVIQESESEEEAEEVIEVPVPVPKKKALPKKWLKPNTEPVRVCCEEKVSKEEPLISDEKPQIVKHVVIPPMKELKKQRQPRASTRTLEIVAEPTPIDVVLDDVKNNDMKYRPQKQVRQAPAPAPVVIKHSELPFKLFDY